MPKAFMVFVTGGVLLILFAGVVALIHSATLTLIYLLALLGWYGGFPLWIAASDAKRRWPHLTHFSQRLVAVFSFDAHHHDRLAAELRDKT